MWARMPNVLALGMCAALTVPWPRDVTSRDFVIIDTRTRRDSWLTMAWRAGVTRSLLS